MEEKPIDKKQQFLDNMVSYGLGEALEEMAEAQQEVLAGVRETAKQGTITFKLTFKRNGKFGIDVIHDIKKTVPKMPGSIASMFLDEENLLHEQDPMNKQLDFDNVADFTKRKDEKIKEA